ncbi:MAG: hypothetical protein RR967_02690 [Anaerovoracaceae bacterium]
MKRKLRRKKLLAIVLSIAMVLNVGSVPALAGEATRVESNGGDVANLEAATLDNVFGTGNYSLSGKSLSLTKDINLTKSINFKGVDCIFDFAGHNITTSGISIGANSGGKNATKMIIKATGGGGIAGMAGGNYGALEIEGKYSSQSLEDTDEIVIEGGTFEGSNCAGIASGSPDALVKVTINGGTFIGSNGNYGVDFSYGGVALTVNGGTFTGGGTAEAVSFGISNNDNGETSYLLKGGTFTTGIDLGASMKMSDILATGKTLKKDGNLATETELSSNKLDGNITVVDDPSKMEKTAVPNISNCTTTDYEGMKKWKFYSKDFKETPVVKIYETSSGGVGSTDNLTVYTGRIEISGREITDPTDLWLTVTESGKTESDRVKITILPKYALVEGVISKSVYSLEFTTISALIDYLNYCEPESATGSGNTINMSKDVLTFHQLYFKGDFVWNFGGKTISNLEKINCSIGIEGNSSDTKLLLKNGKLTGNNTVNVVGQEGGNLTLEGVNIEGSSIGIWTEGKFTMSNSSVNIKKGNRETRSFVVNGQNGRKAEVKIISGTITNENEGNSHFTFLGVGSSSDGPGILTLADCIADGSSTMQKSESFHETHVCKEDITVTQDSVPTPPSYEGSGTESAPYIIGNEADLKDAIKNGTAPIYIKIIENINLADTIKTSKDIEIDLNGNNIAIVDASGDALGKPAIDASGNLVIKGEGTIAGGNGVGNGNGGNCIIGSGDVTIKGNLNIIGGNGAGTGLGGNGINISGSGNIIIEKGSVSGGEGATGGVGAKSENGNVTIKGEGSISGGNGIGSGNGGTGVVTEAGNIVVENGGAVTGGIGGNGSGSTAGGNGGTGTTTGITGNTTVDGIVTGGSGGNGANDGSGSGGAGGTGVNEDGTISGSGTIAAGNGGNIPEGGSGTPGTGGSAITSGGSFGGTTTAGKKGIKANAKVDVVGEAPNTNVLEQELVNGAVTDDERDDASISKIDVILKVEKKSDPTDKGMIDNAVTPGQEVGIYLDILLEKKITKQALTTTENVTQATEPISITITIPDNLRGGSNYKIIRMHNGVAETLIPKYDSMNNTLTFRTDKFSTYAISYTPKESSGGSSVTIDDKAYFWDSVESKVENTKSGDIIKVDAKEYDNMPGSIIKKLKDNKGVTLILKWNRGKDITITSSTALKVPEKTYYSLSYLSKIIAQIDRPGQVRILKSKNYKGKADLKWSRASNGPDGYRIYRSKAKSGKYEGIAWIKNGKAKTYKEKAKKTNKTYYYKVRAYRQTRNGKIWGDYSPIKVVKF